MCALHAGGSIKLATPNTPASLGAVHVHVLIANCGARGSRAAYRS